jgi:hypothetical protein
MLTTGTVKGESSGWLRIVNNIPNTTSAHGWYNRPSKTTGHTYYQCEHKKVYRGVHKGEAIKHEENVRAIFPPSLKETESVSLHNMKGCVYCRQREIRHIMQTRASWDQHHTAALHNGQIVTISYRNTVWREYWPVKVKPLRFKMLIVNVLCSLIFWLQWIVPFWGSVSVYAFWTLKMEVFSFQ